jgi:hypothetical protein
MNITYDHTLKEIFDLFCYYSDSQGPIWVWEGPNYEKAIEILENIYKVGYNNGYIDGANEVSNLCQ